MTNKEKNICIETDFGSLSLTLVQSLRAKRVALKSRPHKNDIALVVPRDGNVNRAIDFARSKAGWIKQTQTKLSKMTHLLPGSIIPVRGIEHKLISIEEPRGRAETIHVAGEKYPILRVFGGEMHFQRRLMDYLYKEAYQDISKSVDHYAKKADVKITGISIKDTRTRWGSCSSAGRLNFSWRLILAPPFVLDYLCAHEVAHRIEMNHSPQYWSIVKNIEPDYLRAEKWLKLNGSKLHQISLS